MGYVIVAIHVLVCFFLIIVVLLQSGKAADLAGAFGGMGSQTAFGPRGAATVLSKATTAAAVIFMLTSIVLSIMATRRGGVGSSVLDSRTTTGRPAPAPAKGAPVPIVPQGSPMAPVNIPIPMPKTTTPGGGSAPIQVQPGGAPPPAVPAGKK